VGVKLQQDASLRLLALLAKNGLDGVEWSCGFDRLAVAPVVGFVEQNGDDRFCTRTAADKPSLWLSIKPNSGSRPQA
jgi:hypothetical protein